MRSATSGAGIRSSGPSIRPARERTPLPHAPNLDPDWPPNLGPASPGRPGIPDPAKSPAAVDHLETMVLLFTNRSPCRPSRRL